MTNENETVTDETLEVEEESTEAEVEETTEEVEEDEETPEQLRARLAKAEELANNYKQRAEKAEKKAKTAPKKESTGELSTTDILALTKADIDEDDIDEVLDYAKYKGISVKEALGSSILKATINERKEERTSAQAVNTGATRRGSSQVSDDRLLADAKKGIMPEKEEDIARLTLLKFKNK